MEVTIDFGGHHEEVVVKVIEMGALRSVAKQKLRRVVNSHRMALLFVGSLASRSTAPLLASRRRRRTRDKYAVSKISHCLEKDSDHGDSPVLTPIWGVLFTTGEAVSGSSI